VSRLQDHQSLLKRQALSAAMPGAMTVATPEQLRLQLPEQPSQHAPPPSPLQSSLVVGLLGALALACLWLCLPAKKKRSGKHLEKPLVKAFGSVLPAPPPQPVALPEQQASGAWHGDPLAVLASGFGLQDFRRPLLRSLRRFPLRPVQKAAVGCVLPLAAVRPQPAAQMQL